MTEPANLAPSVPSPLSRAAADAVAESQRLLKRAEHFSDYTDERAQAAAQMATAQVLVAIGGQIATIGARLDQLAGIRREIAGLTGAVRELTTAVIKSAESLPDIANAISDTPDHGQVLGDIATAVESLATSLDRPRRSWFHRRKSTEVPA
jgi:hypothetical protein